MLSFRYAMTECRWPFRFYSLTIEQINRQNEHRGRSMSDVDCFSHTHERIIDHSLGAPVK